MSPRRLLALFLTAAFALAAVLVVALAGRDDERSAVSGEQPAGALIPAGVRAPDFALSDERGERLTMRELRGRPVVVTFLYTHCDETCPPAAQQVKGALDRLGHDLPALAIAVDPPRDTPASARAFLSKARMLGRLRFVLGSRRQLEPLWRGYAIQPQAADAEHQARIVLVDRDGMQRIGFPVSRATPEAIAHDLRLLEDEGR